MAVAKGPDGTIYAMGGYNGDAVAKVWAYDTHTNLWSPRSDLPFGTWEGAAATGQDGLIYFFGGESTTEMYSNDVYVYNPNTDTYQQKTT